MRWIIALIFTTHAGFAWEHRPTPICTVSHDDDEVALKMTYDSVDKLYALTLTKQTGLWDNGSSFSIRFDGPSPIFISTDRHYMSDDGRSVTAEDRGFGNVINGIALNFIATIRLGEDRPIISLVDADAAIDAFKKCTIELRL